MFDIHLCGAHLESGGVLPFKLEFGIFLFSNWIAFVRRDSHSFEGSSSPSHYFLSLFDCWRSSFTVSVLVGVLRWSNLCRPISVVSSQDHDADDPINLGAILNTDFGAVKILVFLGTAFFPGEFFFGSTIVDIE